MLGRILSRSNSLRYEEIPSHHDAAREKDGIGSADSWDDRSFFRSRSKTKAVMVGMIALLVGIVVVQGVYVEEESQELMAEAVNSIYKTERDTAADGDSDGIPVPGEANGIPMPYGVNLGSWLSLEDYFFAGMENSIEVATPDDEEAGSCLPPLHVGSTTGPMWHSETDLFRSLIDEKGAEHAIRVFAAHRASFIDLETDLAKIAALGIQTVRIPIGWCLTDVDPTKVDLAMYGSDEALLNDFACVDPFFGIGDDQFGADDQKVLWPAIPRPLIEDILKACHDAGIGAALDVHTLPGGTSPGTFSGVWPKKPRFWTHGGDGVSIDDKPSVNAGTTGFGIGHELFRELVAWMEDLSDRDPDAFAGLRGISPMNEPAHLAGYQEPHGDTNFLPLLPKGIEDDYAAGMAAAIGIITPFVPEGTALRVFYWFDTALSIFRSSRLPGLGVDFYANIIESILPDKQDQKQKISVIAKWWCARTNRHGSTTASERADWAVLDIHHYNAWGANCAGSIDGQDASYTCNDAAKRREVLEVCTEFAGDFRDAVDEACGSTTDDVGTVASARLMSGEFAPASFHTVRKSCTDLASLRDSYLAQVTTARPANVDLFYWSYKMPYGGSFREAGWSFTQMMYRFGVLDQPDAPAFPCDNHTGRTKKRFV